MNALGSCFAVLASAALASAQIEFEDRRVVSPSGQRYAVVRQSGLGITYELCERQRGASPMPPALAASVWWDVEVDVSRDPADRVVVAGRCDQLPGAVYVLDRVPGLLLVDHRGGREPGRAVTWLRADGKLGFRPGLHDVFGAAPLDVQVHSEGWSWRRDCAFDEARGALLLVANSGELREIAVPAGTVTTPDARRLADFARAGSEAVRTLAFDALAQRPPVAARELLPTAAAVFHDRSEPIALRLRAAVALHRAGIAVDGATELFAAGRAAEQPEAVRRFAVRGLGAVLGVDALPPLCELLRTESPFAWEARLSLGAIGAAAVPALLAMLGEHDANTNYRAAAAGALGVIRSADARDGLLRAARDDDYWVATEAVAARIETGGPQLSADLIDLLATRPDHAPAIARHFAAHPDRAAAPALAAVLPHVGDVHFRREVEDALAACRR